jgi:hypothetical protein
LRRAITRSAGAPGISIVWRAAYWLIILGTALALYKSYNVGRDMRAIAQERFDQAIASEDRNFCEKFGLPTGTSRYLSCCQELSIIRQRQRDRDFQASSGLL